MNIVRVFNAPELLALTPRLALIAAIVSAVLTARNPVRGESANGEPGQNAREVAPIKQGYAPVKPSNSEEKSHESREKLTTDLRRATAQFIEAADRSDVNTVATMYAPDFVNVRVTDAGDVVELKRDHILSFFAHAGGKHIPTKSTTIHHVEIVGDTGYVLLTRVKDIGNGWEPMFYSLVWQHQGDDWLLLREFVHQRTMQKGPQATR